MASGYDLAEQNIDQSIAGMDRLEAAQQRLNDRRMLFDLSAAVREAQSDVNATAAGDVAGATNAARQAAQTYAQD